MQARELINHTFPWELAPGVPHEVTARTDGTRDVSALAAEPEDDPSSPRDAPRPAASRAA